MRNLIVKTTSVHVVFLIVKVVILLFLYYCKHDVIVKKLGINIFMYKLQTI